MRKSSVVLWFVCGAALLLSFCSGRAGLVDAHTIELIDQARMLDFDEDWPGFQPGIYPLDIYRKNLLTRDSVIRYDSDGLREIKDRTPVFALSLEVVPDGQVVVLLLNARDFRSFADAGDLDASSADLYYQAAICHEAFHCFQAGQGLYDVYADGITARDGSTVPATSRLLDADDEYRRLWVQEMEALAQYARTCQNHQLCFAAYQARLDYLYSRFDDTEVQEYLDYAAFYEKVEGTAQYIENITLSKLSGKDLEFALTGYAEGTAKFYSSGFFKAFILDRVADFDWKTDFFNTSVTFEDYLFTVPLQECQEEQ